MLEKLTTNDKIIHTALFCLSNVTGGTKSHIRLFIDSEILVTTVIMMLRANTHVIAGEASWVLTNAISLCELEDLKTLIRVYDKNLVHSLCHMLERCHAQKSCREANEILSALDRLMSLDKESGCEFTDENSVAVMVEECGGFDAISAI